MFLNSLSWKINSAIISVLALVLGGSAWVTIEAQNQQAIANTKSQAKILSKTLTNIIRIDMEGRCQKDVMKVIRMMGEFQDIETLRIFNADGVIMHSATPGEVGLEVDELVYNVFQSRDRSKPFDSDEAGHRSFCMVEVMYNEPNCHSCHDPQQEIVGVLEVCLSMAQTEAQIRQNGRFMMGTTGVTVILVTAAISLFFLVMVNRPVRTLASTMKRAEEGDLEVRVPEGHDDELGRLARSFNSMVAQLEESNREVARLHHEQMTRSERLASIGEMAASVAHEIKNPLAGLAGATQVLAGSFKEGDERYAVVQEMLKLTGRLDQTILDLLSFARESVPNWTWANPNDVVDETLFFVRQEDHEGDVGIDVALDPDMPEIPMDPQQIQQVLLNLVINARQATGRNGRVIVTTTARLSGGRIDGWADEGFVEILVADDGPGIDTEAQREVFKPFHTTKTQGTGLGLPICRKIVDAHGGVLHLESTPGEGARFYLWLHRERVEV